MRFVIGFGYGYVVLSSSAPFVQRKKSSSFVVLFGRDRGEKW